MKRFLVFGGDVYYPSGGWRDLLEGFDSGENAIAYAQGYANADRLHWSLVADTQEADKEKQIIFTSER